MSSLIVTAYNSIHAIQQLVNTADMQGRDLNASHLRSICMDDADWDYAIKLCDERGVDIKGLPRQARKFDSITYVPR